MRGGVTDRPGGWKGPPSGISKLAAEVQGRIEAPRTNRRRERWIGLKRDMPVGVEVSPPAAGDLWETG